MSSPVTRGEKIQVNIKAPQQLHHVHPHSAKHHQISVKEIGISQIKEQTKEQTQVPNRTPHKIRHIDSVDDKGEFIDEKHHNRVSENDQVRETINRTIHPEPQLPTEDTQLQKIDEEGNNQEPQYKPLKHLQADEMQDKDQFNLRSSRLSQNNTRKRRLSESNLDRYVETRTHFSVVDYLNKLKKTVPEKIIEEEAEFDKKDRHFVSPPKRERKKSVHSVYRHHSNGGISQEIERMIVDEIDKKKKAKQDFNSQMQEEDSQMESIKEQKQEEDPINTYKLEETREKVEQQLSGLSKVTGRQIGPENTQHLTIDKEKPIEEVSNSELQN